MREFIAAINKVRNESGVHAAALATKYNIAAYEFPIGALGMCFNNATLTLELTSHYSAAWSSPDEQLIKARAEATERLVLISKSMFVWCLSAIEHSSKEAFKKYPTALPPPARPIKYFANVIEYSVDHGLIDASARRLWFGTNTLRNRIVHNNGIGDATDAWNFSNDLTLVMEKGKMIEGSIMTFPLLTDWLITQYALWCDRFLMKALSGRTDASIDRAP